MRPFLLPFAACLMIASTGEKENLAGSVGQAPLVLG